MMKKLIVMSLLLMTILPIVSAAGGFAGIGGSVGVEDFAPIVWQCGDRVVWDEEIQPWRTSGDNQELFERTSNYIFTGETYQVDVVVFDKNKIQDVVVDLILDSNLATPGAEISANCIPASNPSNTAFRECGAKIDEEVINTFDSSTMKAYTCKIDVPSVSGEYWVSVQAERGSQQGSVDEFAKWYLNPAISLSVEGSVNFGNNVRPGTTATSPSVQVKSTSQGGVLLDMFITGKDWYPTGSNLGRCWDETTGQLVNFLPLSAFSYYAEQGAYSTRDEVTPQDNGYSSVVRNVDSEGYVNINRLINEGFEEKMFDDAEIIQAGNPVYGALGYNANTISSGTTGISMTFKLDLPEPCYGNYQAPSGGAFIIWAEAI